MRTRGQDLLAGGRAYGAACRAGQDVLWDSEGFSMAQRYAGLKGHGRGSSREMGQIMLCGSFGFYLMDAREPVKSFEQARSIQFVN